VVSIIIPCFNQWRHTNACLLALAATWDATIAAEVIVVDDGSSDATQRLLALCSGIRAVRRDDNGGFIAACNSGAAQARGRYLHFLNNDALVGESWLRPLVDAFERDDRTGAVVSQLRYFDETLSEAGGVIWQDGRGSNYGRGGSPADSGYRYVRDVDYGSGASLMVRRDRFEEIGGFSPEYAPAYYEDADLCFALRERGYRTLYQPKSVVYHAEGASYGSNVSRSSTQLQERNRALFARKWAAQLAAHLPPDAVQIERAARRLMGRSVVVLLDEHVPFADRDAGAQRTAFVIEQLRARGYHVIFASVDRDDYPPYGDRLRDMGVETMLGFGAGSIGATAAMRLPIGLAWLCRPGPGEMAGAFRNAFPAAKLVFDTVDLHYLRLEREERATGRQTHWQAMRAKELAIVAQVDRTIVTSPVEQSMLENELAANVAVVSVVQPAVARARRPWAQTSGIVFVGNYGHSPNVDAAQWLTAEIMPSVWQACPEIQLTLAGAEPTRAIRLLAETRVSVPGFVEDLDGTLMQHRVFVAPLRFGAGIKGKILQALAAGLPVVATPVAAEGIFTDGECGAIVSTPHEFAQAILRLYEDRELWERFARATTEVASRFSPAVVANQLDRVLTEL
jgi:O-antigen biosynthesis protein